MPTPPLVVELKRIDLFAIALYTLLSNTCCVISKVPTRLELQSGSIGQVQQFQIMGRHVRVHV
jgi:hypothetical protein